jgi:hypothetical protein
MFFLLDIASDDYDFRFLSVYNEPAATVLVVLASGLLHRLKNVSGDEIFWLFACAALYIIRCHRGVVFASGSPFDAHFHSRVVRNFRVVRNHPHRGL